MEDPSHAYTALSEMSLDGERQSLKEVIAPLLLILLFLCTAALCFAEEIKDDTDPSKIVFLSLREEYYNLKTGTSINRIIYRSDKAIWKTAKLAPKGLTLRWDFPVVTANTPSRTKTGLGDLYFQGLFFPRLRKTFILAAGTAFVFPTATDDLLGNGKWQFAPLVVPIWLFPKQKGYFLTKVQDFISFAGGDDRPDIHFLLITPTMLWRISGRSWILFDTEALTDWKKGNRTNFKSGLQLGRMFTPGLASG